jgi:hypothetical protein
MSTRWQERVDRRRLTLPVGQNVLQASRNQLCDDIDLRFQHHAVPGERPIRYGVPAIGAQTTTWLEVH